MPMRSYSEVLQLVLQTASPVSSWLVMLNLSHIDTVKPSNLEAAAHLHIALKSFGAFAHEGSLSVIRIQQYEIT